MKDYGKMSDFEINKAVAELLGLEMSSSHDGAYVGVVRRSIGSRPNYIHVNYCNNPSDAWPIMEECKIGLAFVNGEWRASSVKAGYHEYSDKNALRAAMIVYLISFHIFFCKCGLARPRQTHQHNKVVHTNTPILF